MRVVAFGAHPDDVDLYAGGLVAGLARRGAGVVIVDLTAGELGTRGTAEGRAAEAEEAARILGATRENLGLPDGHLHAGSEAQLRAVVEALRRHRPALVLAPWREDPHPDHAATHELVRKARFLARLARWPADGEPCRPGPVLFYEQKTTFEPHLVVDIGADRETKRAAIAAFGSQFRREEGDPVRTEISEPDFHAALDARSRVHGRRIGVTWGEGYRREGAHPVLDPLQLLASAPPGAAGELS
jgi:bacillithiol biosynthesis deacetylase BshB1